MTQEPPRHLPRELAPGIHWMGECLEIPYRGTYLHSGDSAFLVSGDDASMLVEAGLPVDLEVVERQLESLLARDDVPPLQYIWATHQETPHAGGIGYFLDRFPDTTFVGNAKDYHLFFPQHEHRFHPLEIGESIDLGGTEFRAVKPVIHDLITTQWGFDTRRRALFTGDGFAYAHYHLAGQCTLFAEEVEELDIPDMTSLFSEQSLRWSKYHDMEPIAQRLEALMEELDVAIVGPTHGLPITDVAVTLPKVIDGLLSAHRVAHASG
jgi:flavorubredoxin